MATDALRARKEESALAVRGAGRWRGLLGGLIHECEAAA